MKIYITRHSKTIWNEERKLQGRKDSDLTKEGYENAYALKEYISNLHIDYIFTSPIKRALNTAQILFNHDIIIDERLIEMNFGDFEGMYIPDLLKRSDCIYYNLWNRPELFDRINNGESYEDVYERAYSFLRDIETYDENSSIFIVTHGMFFIVLLACMLGYDKTNLTQINKQVADGCSLTCINYDGHYHIDYYNKNDFLPHLSHQSFNK